MDKALKTTFTFNMNSPKFRYGLSRTSYPDTKEQFLSHIPIGKKWK